MMGAPSPRVFILTDIGEKGKNVNHVLGFQDFAQKTHVNFSSHGPKQIAR